MKIRITMVMHSVLLRQQTDWDDVSRVLNHWKVNFNFEEIASPRLCKALELSKSNLINFCSSWIDTEMKMCKLLKLIKKPMWESKYFASLCYRTSGTRKQNLMFHSFDFRVFFFSFNFVAFLQNHHQFSPVRIILHIHYIL